jgi:D-inositol-3-phosphate glycosyltransferase
MNKRISPLKITLLTGGIDKHYACGLSQALASAGIAVDVICNTEMNDREMQGAANLRLLALYATPRRNQTTAQKLLAYILVYARLIHYAATSSAPIFHILWNYKFKLFDRTILLLYFKLLGKRLVFTAHNINAAERDGVDSLLNRASLRIQYGLVDHIFVHTEKMKDQLVRTFGARDEKITVIPFGTYDMVPQSTLTPAEAKQRLGLCRSDRTILFFGRIAPYKGIDVLVNAFERVALQDQSYRLVIAGEPIKEGEQQWLRVQRAIEQSPIREQVVQHIRYIADKEIELYFKGADVLVLPYTEIFQSGVLFMAYSFGLPVIATDVGSFGQDINAGITGYVCRPSDPGDLSRVIEMYFASELFRTLDEQRASIKDSIQRNHSWNIAAGKTGDVYAQLSRHKELQYST